MFVIKFLKPIPEATPIEAEKPDTSPLPITFADIVEAVLLPCFVSPAENTADMLFLPAVMPDILIGTILLTRPPIYPTGSAARSQTTHRETVPIACYFIGHSTILSIRGLFLDRIAIPMKSPVQIAPRSLSLIHI